MADFPLETPAQSWLGSIVSRGVHSPPCLRAKILVPPPKNIPPCLQISLVPPPQEENYAIQKNWDLILNNHGCQDIYNSNYV